MAAKDRSDSTTISQDSTGTISRPLETNNISLDEAQEIVHIGTWQWEVATGAIAWSDELYRIYGLKPRKEALGFDEFVQLIHPEDREKVTNIVNEAYQTKQSFEFEHRIVLPNKKIRILHGKGKVFADATGAVTRMIGTSQDITERKKADQALHRSEERFNAVSTATNDVVYDVDLSANTIWFNKALNSEYGYPKQKAARTRGWRISHIHPDDRDRIKNSLDTQLGSGENTWVGEYRFQKHDGTYIDIRDRAVVLRDVDEKPARIIGSMLDITQQKELQRAKDRFISLVSHQLRTPLTSMRLFTEMLSRDQTEDLSDTQKDYVRKIESSTLRMINLVNEILNVSSVETGHLHVHLAPADINAIILSQIEEISPLASEKRLTITYEPSAQSQVASVDPMLFSQIVHNLLTNAVRYTVKEGSVITVDFKKTKGQYLLTVEDQGIGIPKSAQPHIFSSFFRANNAVKTVPDGTGLGLYLTKLIVDMSGGNIWYESDEHKGTLFSVSLPLTGMQVTRHGTSKHDSSRT